MSDLELDAEGPGAAPDARPARAYTHTRLAHAALLVFVGYYVGSRLGLALTFLPNPLSPTEPAA